MTWNLFIDDDRMPVDVKWAPYNIYAKYLSEEWVICRNKTEVMQAISEHGNNIPNFISFDHDLGKNEPSGYDITRLIVDKVMDGIFVIPSDFQFFVHSKNPIGAKNIQSYLDKYLQFI